MTSPSSLTPRQIAGRLNRAKQKGLTDAGRQSLRFAAAANKAWRHSTSPRTVEGKAASAANGIRCQKGTVSVRERRRLVADATEMVMSMKALRGEVLENRSSADDGIGLGGDPGSN
jgi:hypothetical protein